MAAAVASAMASVVASTMASVMAGDGPRAVAAVIDGAVAGGMAIAVARAVAGAMAAAVADDVARDMVRAVAGAVVCPKAVRCLLLVTAIAVSCCLVPLVLLAAARCQDRPPCAQAVHIPKRLCLLLSSSTQEKSAGLEANNYLLLPSRRRLL